MNYQFDWSVVTSNFPRLLEGLVLTLEIAVIVIAIGFGALGLSHVTDAGFWVVVRYYGLTVSDGLKTWTVLTTILGVAGFLLTFVAWILVGGLGA